MKSIFFFLSLEYSNFIPYYFLFLQIYPGGYFQVDLSILVDFRPLDKFQNI